MSRSGYSDDCYDNWASIMWRGRVASSTRGKRGQKLLTELIEALDAMPEKKLITKKLECTDGLCTLGVLGKKRGVEMDTIHPEDYDEVAKAFDVAAPLAQEIVYMNDEYFDHCTPEERWTQMREWVGKQIVKPKETK